MSLPYSLIDFKQSSIVTVLSEKAIHQTCRNSLIAFKFLFKTFFDKWVHEDLS